METTSFFAGTTRPVTLGSPTLLIAKGGTRRLRLPIKLPLGTGSVVGMPDWLSDAFTAVSQNFTEVQPQVQQIPDVSLAFRNTEPSPELFAVPDARLANAELRKFTVLRTGESDDPDVELHVTIYAPFARDFWRWIGEMAGQEVHVHFPSTKSGQVEVVAPTLPLDQAQQFVAERPELDQQCDSEIPMSGIPTDPTLESDFGPGSPEFEASVRESVVTKGRKNKAAQAKAGVESNPAKPSGRRSLTVN